MNIVEATAGAPAHTNGHTVFVSAAGSQARHRHEVLLQSALLGAGSLDAHMVIPLRGRPAVARRYLALEGRRALANLAGRVPLAAALSLDANPCTASAFESLDIARGRTAVATAPDWFGVIRPSLLLSNGPTRGAEAGQGLELETADPTGDDDDAETEGSKILELFENPAMKSNALANFLRELFGNARSSGRNAAGAETNFGSIRRAHSAGPDAKPSPTRIRFTDDAKPGSAIGVAGMLLPEWDVHRDRYRPDWCRVVTFPLTAAADVSTAAVCRDDVLKKRLSRIGLGQKVLRRRTDGEDLDLEALVDLVVDLRSGHSPPEHVYIERRKVARDLGVLILLDSSGSATDTDSAGLAVHEHQRRAAATIGATLEDLGDRVAVYAFRSQGRHAVHLMAVKAFGQRFSAAARTRLNTLQPTGYTRLGAAIRGAADILERQAGTPNRLLLVLSDGFPYDHDYEGRYAESDTAKAIEELRAEGLGCLCLSIGSTGGIEALRRVFGSANHASGSTLAELSPTMDDMFLASLRELAAPIPARR
ncbi:MAG TPA: VWA domain-containing protein [Mycobacterium sp.]|nr:VWA domain-containing protein [Mycobacterium sp.]